MSRSLILNTLLKLDMLRQYLLLQNSARKNKVYEGIIAGLEAIPETFWNSKTKDNCLTESGKKKIYQQIYKQEKQLLQLCAQLPDKKMARDSKLAISTEIAELKKAILQIHTPFPIADIFLLQESHNI